MSQNTLRRLRLIYGIALSVLLVALGICFMVSCVSIYRTGASPFNPESIGAAFDRFAPLAYVTIVLVVIGFIGDLWLSLKGAEPAVSPKARRDLVATRDSLAGRVDLTRCTDDTRTAIRSARREQKAMVWSAAIVSVIAAVPPLLWCLDRRHFGDPGDMTTDLNGDIIAAARIILPCALAALALWVLAMCLRAASIRREIALLKGALVELAKSEKGNADKEKTTAKLSASASKKGIRAPRLFWCVRGAILAVGIVFIVLGVLNGGMADVLGKAVRICTECIGLG